MILGQQMTTETKLMTWDNQLKCKKQFVIANATAKLVTYETITRRLWNDGKNITSSKLELLTSQ